MCPPLGGCESGTVSSGPWAEEPDDEYPSPSSSSMVVADGRISWVGLVDCRLKKNLCKQDATCQLLRVSFM